ncbi:histidine ammonia-lyase [Haloarchaeobius sp. FL176]|uniref:histidine ammonia-lyase n=1 Tax=Haloarchaeobius sp. FL176 TaxID=2967129 RepID=UPI0021494DE4|nr:histidine ammonia-lyase [Haloarchaeobius sp. FL176]
MTVELTGEDLTIESAVACARDGEDVAVSDEALERVRKARSNLESRIGTGEIIYGVNTGFGASQNEIIDSEDVTTLQTNLIRSNAVCVGDPVEEDEARMMMLLRLNSLLSGSSGVREHVILKLQDLLNRGFYPHVPRKGSVSASGDLAPLAHIALAMLGEGKAWNGEKWVPSSDVLDSIGVEPLSTDDGETGLEAKEGLALINGTNYITAVATLAVHDAERLLDTADTVGTMTLEAFRGLSDPFRAEIHELRNHPGQKEVARRVREGIEGSELVTAAADANRAQDSYSLRCIPQVHGASRDTVAHVREVVERELNAVTDNPLVLNQGEGDVVSGGNFHGQPIAFVIDQLSMAIAEIANISERRIFKLTGGEPEGRTDGTTASEHSDGLPPFLVEDPGLNCGFMMPHVTAAALVSENKTLVHPSSTDSIPTSDNQEDHVSMGANGANHLVEVLDNVETVLAIELFASYTALDYRDGSPGQKASEIVDTLEETVAPLTEDRLMQDDFASLRSLIRTGAIE